MSFITEIDFSKVVSHPISLPQTEIQRGETIVISTLVLGRQKKADLVWLDLHVPRISAATRSSELTMASQSGVTVTSDYPIFISQDVGAIIRWASGEEATVVRYDSPVSVAVNTSQSVTLNYFEVIGTLPQLINSGLGTVYVGLYTEQFFRLNRPCGNPIYYLTMDAPGTVSLPARSRRVLSGPDVISVAITNNTYNLDIVEAVVAGSLKA